MKYFDLVKRSARSLKSARVRTFLTAMAIGVGGFTLALTLAAGNGVRDYTTKLISTNFDPAELVVGRDKQVANTGNPSDKPQEYNSSVASFTGAGQKASLQLKQVTQNDVEELRKNPHIEKVRENYQLTLRYVSREGQKKYTGAGQAYNQAQKPESKTGVIPANGDIAKGTVLLPDTYIDLLGFKDANDAIGKQVTLTVQQPFSITSIQALLQNQKTTDLSQVAGSLTPQEKTYTFTVAAVTKKAATSLSFGTSPRV